MSRPLRVFDASSTIWSSVVDAVDAGIVFGISCAAARQGDSSSAASDARDHPRRAPAFMRGTPSCTEPVFPAPQFGEGVDAVPQGPADMRSDRIADRRRIDTQK